MYRVLLIDDDAMITGPLARALGEAGYEVRVAHDGESGLAAALAEQPALVVLDVMLPGLDGWQVCQRLRSRSTVPILMLTALGDEVDRILGLELGADDYLTKPFSTRELLARIRAMLRRVRLEHEPPQSGLRVGAIRLDLETRQVFKGEQELELRYKEFELLSLLMSRQGEVVSRAQLFDEVWGTDWLGDTRTLDVHIRWLREKIEDDPSNPRYIRTIRGVGYRFARPSEVAK
ncbi:MAG TPA: response regulator transcription factor [Caldilineaceae bacterium]|nr:response regulator transcription factor [Caldilineaceae bacterium]